jgi:hypothetical protein
MGEIVTRAVVILVVGAAVFGSSHPPPAVGVTDTWYLPSFTHSPIDQRLG